ncbi:helix-turn-helix transcriptional regulator (plasmid) [Paraburkholderia sp. D15]|uniref:helix-turn-helix domain-containing protein n=1 Tax=Paraburkholderia sp. D15 TaxID=2880218 RepID=UPI002479B0BA|nr:helix-turn-helix transcriptional regulator [Paraburkholderia sp. D15]WGS54925.1 helix-turn-helix transcriptional regulator [Paraburkholderia sp. D15]
MSDRQANDKTPWFPPSSKPVRKGLYESHWLIGSQTRLRFWDGVFWQVDGQVCSEQDLTWRGRACPDRDYVVDDVSVHFTESPSIPQNIRNAVAGGITPAKAWRQHLGLKQAEVAARIGISRPGYAFLERKKRLSERTRASVAAAFGIAAEQLDL